MVDPAPARCRSAGGGGGAGRLRLAIPLSRRSPFALSVWPRSGNLRRRGANHARGWSALPRRLGFQATGDLLRLRRRSPSVRPRHGRHSYRGGDRASIPFSRVPRALQTLGRFVAPGLARRCPVGHGLRPARILEHGTARRLCGPLPDLGAGLMFQRARHLAEPWWGRAEGALAAGRRGLRDGWGAQAADWPGPWC